MILFVILFIIFTIMHPIADFIVRTKTWEKPYCDKLHYILSLNPLHWLYDITLGLKHSKYSTKFDNTISYQIRSAGNKHSSDVSFQTFQQPYSFDLIERPFWLYLGIDQLMHVMLNLIFALFVDIIIMELFN